MIPLTDNGATIPMPEMTFSSSPTEGSEDTIPASKDGPFQQPKRKLFQHFNNEEHTNKKSKLGIFESANTNFTTSKETRQLQDEIDCDPDAAKSVAQAVELTQIDNLSDSGKGGIQALGINLPVSQDSRVRDTARVQTCCGKSFSLKTRQRQSIQTFEQVIAERSTTKEGRAKRAYYGVEIHSLVDEARIHQELDKAQREAEAQKTVEISPSVEHPISSHGRRSTKHQLWTEKYRAKKFTELVGDERTHRSVLRWLKRWDQLVFPGNRRAKSDIHQDEQDQHRKIMLLTGPPGLGKTTLAHVCARQAGYEVLEINASDDRSRDVVKGQIKDALGTETVRGIREAGQRKAGRPVCVVVDEVDGVVSGSGGSAGEGGFMKALIDLVHLDQKTAQIPRTTKKGKKQERFSMLRPLILICNDVYAPALRPLRQSSLAEIVHVRKPALEKVVGRLKTVFEKENIPADNDAIRRLCESAWGLGARSQSSQAPYGAGDGDIRGVLVQGEWIARKLHAQSEKRLSRKWVELQLSDGSTAKGQGQSGIGRGGVREIVDRIFVEGAGLNNVAIHHSVEEQRQTKDAHTTPTGIAELRKRTAISALHEMMGTSGDHDRIVADCFSVYPTMTFQDDTFLSKPNASYDWLHFHDSLSSRLYSGQEWEVAPYMSSSACAFHSLFAGLDNRAQNWQSNHNRDSKKEDEEDTNSHPFAGLKADFAAYEAEKQNYTTLTELQSKLPAELLRPYSSTANVATELIPYISRMLAPDIKPVVIGGSSHGGSSTASVRKDIEKACVKRAVHVMSQLDINLEKVRIESEGYQAAGNIFRMEPPVDLLASYYMEAPTHGLTVTGAPPKLIHSSSTTGSTTGPVRYAVRQVLEQELRKEKILAATEARALRSGEANPTTMIRDSIDAGKENLNPEQEVKAGKVKKDFFGRILASELDAKAGLKGGNARKDLTREGGSNGAEASDNGRIWVSFHEGYSNAVRKPITMQDLLDSF